MIYSVYHTFRTSYGESREVFATAIIPVCQPHRTETVIIAESGMKLLIGQGEDLLCYAKIGNLSEYI